MSVPEPSELKLVTMTVSYELNVNINLRVIYFNLKLDDTILGIKCDNDNKGILSKEHSIKDFKNQCTIILKITWYEKGIENSKLLNTKLFNNGKVIFTGCTNLEQIDIAMKYLINKINNLKGCIPDVYTLILNDKILKRKEYIKNNIIFYIKNKLNVETITQEVYLVYSLIKIYFPYKDPLYNTLPCTDEEITEEYLVLYNFINDLIANIKSLDTYIFPLYALDTIYSLYLLYDKSLIHIVNINSRMNCGFSINRDKAALLLKKYNDHILKINYDEFYPGIKIKYKYHNEEKGISEDLTVTIFNSGKINITSTKSQEQTDEIYKFICDFCRDNFHEIYIECDSDVKKKKYITNLPNHFTIATDDDKYVFIKKQFILSNPRNKIILDKLGIFIV